MSFDLNAILDAAGARRGAPSLIALAHGVQGGRASTTGYFWSTGRVYATVGAHTARIKRHLGTIGHAGRMDDLVVKASELRPLAAACRDWARYRDEWAAFYFSTSGYPAGMGGASYYRPPGADAERVFIGSVCLGRERGKALEGRDEHVLLEAPRAIAPSVVVVGEIWRIGEQHGPKRGSLVGLRYRVGEGLFLDAERTGARLWRQQGDGEVELEPGEEAFVRALLDVVGGGRARSRRRARGAIA
jgi:hypothetical protein